MSANENKKRIFVNPELLKFTSRRQTRKKTAEDKSKPKVPKIQLKPAEKATSEKTIRRKVLKHILDRQRENYKELIETGEQQEKVKKPSETTNYAQEFENEFKDSQEFWKQMVQQQQQHSQHKPPVQKPQTLKRAPVHVSNPFLKPPVPPSLSLVPAPPAVPLTATSLPLPPLACPEKVEPEIMHLDFNANAGLGDPFTPMPPLPAVAMPQYGCLKGGRLPTYRSCKMLQTGGGNGNGSEVSTSTALTHAQQKEEMRKFLALKKQEKQRIKRAAKMQHVVNPAAMAARKQKRTIKRTFRVGKSKVHPKVGVLLGNKTLRTQVLAKKQEVRETPIEEIRRYLIRRGFVRVGSTCPNDVLRQMYESAMMMGGEINNHNPHNMVYNYLRNELE